MTDVNGHGTRVAGTLGALANNGIGNAGVVWGANMMPVKISETSSVNASNTASAIVWAADNGARIINLSLGFTSNSATLKTAIDYAFNAGCLIVAATGNSNAAVLFPAAYPNVFGIGGTSNGTTKATNSNFGNGLDVLASWSWSTTSNANQTVTAGGSSHASPQVAGLAALVWELAPHLSNVQVMQLIRDNTNRGNGSWDNQTGFGIIDMGKTLAAAQALAGEETEEEDTTPPVLTLLGNAVITINEGETYIEPGFTAIDDVDGDITHLVTVSGEVATAFAGRYTLTYTVFDQAGNTATATRVVEVLPVTAPPPVQVPPVISQIGSNPIILHLGGSPYIEQGAVATCNVDDDITHLITTTGNVNTDRAGTYQVTYSVRNSAGLSSSVTREVRVLAPTETRLPRTPHSFTVNGKVNASSTNSITAEAAGNMSLTVTLANKTSGRVVVTNGAGTQVFNQVFSGNGSREIWLEAGIYTITGTITEGNGNTNFTMALRMPEVVYMDFAQAEIPLGAWQQAGNQHLPIYLISILGVSFVGLYLVVQYEKRSKNKTG